MQVAVKLCPERLVVLVVAVCLLFVQVLAGCAQQDQVAAEFGDTVITEQEVSDYTAAFRTRGSYDDEASWKAYLASQNMSVEQWREGVIRRLATRELVRQRAAELGIEPNEADIERSVLAAKQAYGVALDDEQAWSDALAQRGYTPQSYRQECEYASIEQQVISTDASEELEQSSSQIQDYIDANLADRVVRRFSVLSFPDSQEAAAQAVLDELSGLEGDVRAERFEALVAERSAAGDNSLFSGDLGWDILYSTEGIMDSELKIDVMAGDLYPELVDAQGCWQVYVCTARFIFEPDAKYSAIEDESLKSALKTATLNSTVSTVRSAYLSQLVDAAQVQVHAMPDNVPYNTAS